MLTPQDRAQAAYNALSAAGRLNGCNDTERQSVLTQLKVFLGADVAYLTSAAVILPGSIKGQPGAAVSTATGPGTVTGLTVLAGGGILS